MVCVSSFHRDAGPSMTTHGSDNDCALVLMCKRPRPGSSKQRVAATAGVDAALTLSNLLIDCAIADLEDWHGHRVIAVADEDDMDWARSLLPDAEVLAQGDGNLGERLQQVAMTLSTKRPRMLFMGIDAPTLAPPDFHAAANQLNASDVVLMPADDGGVVLMGCRQAWPPLAGLPWSSAALGETLAAHCEQRGLSVAWLDAIHDDIDHASQFAALGAALAEDARPSRVALTRWLKQQGANQAEACRSAI